jgi:hypothetical protein
MLSGYLVGAWLKLLALILISKNIIGIGFDFWNQLFKNLVPKPKFIILKNWTWNCIFSSIYVWKYWRLELIVLKLKKLWGLTKC